MNDHFRIGLSSEDMAARLQIPAQILVVVDFAVENDPYGFVFVAEGLVAGVQIDDGKPAKPKPDWPGAVVALVIGTAMLNGVRHRLEQPARYASRAIEIQFAANAAHASVSSFL
jgi:hypothetical protein